MDEAELKQARSLLREILLEAGASMRLEGAEIGPVDYKSATEIVTTIDRAVENRIIGELKRHYPEDAIVAEESDAEAGVSGRTWYIDPIDGTTNFVHGYPFYCVSVGCWRGDDPVLGGVYAPALDELYLAVAGAGATEEHPRRGGERTLPRREPVALERALLSTGFSYIRDERIDANTRTVARFLHRNCHGVRRGGSAAMDLVHVASGRLDGFWEVSLRPWDVAAGVLIARETGAIVTDFSGHAGRPAGASVIAAAPELHDAIREVVAAESWPEGIA